MKLFVLLCVSIAVTADNGAAGGDQYPQWAPVGRTDKTGLPDRDQNHLQDMEVSLFYQL